VKRSEGGVVVRYVVRDTTATSWMDHRDRHGTGGLQAMHLVARRVSSRIPESLAGSLARRAPIACHDRRERGCQRFQRESANNCFPADASHDGRIYIHCTSKSSSQPLATCRDKASEMPFAFRWLRYRCRVGSPVVRTAEASEAECAQIMREL
jgi:hypothetical protein